METSESPVPYTVEYSGAVRQRLRQMAREASARGDAPAFTTALKKIDRLLRLYPQFGDPQIDLTAESGVIYLAIIPPIFIRYGVYEGRRLVLVGALPILLPMQKPDTEATE
jgi:hypothetical protein